MLCEQFVGCTLFRDRVLVSWYVHSFLSSGAGQGRTAPGGGDAMEFVAYC